ncbi:MAG: hypothetical protein IIV16_00350, partial [Alistipes sp.]|nr:hypothetical protein [Alistipes sp.]
AERASIKYKQVEYMADRMGIAYDAIISGVTEWGIYAEIIENKCEGLSLHTARSSSTKISPSAVLLMV